MIYEVYKVGEQDCKKVSCENPKEAIYKILGVKKKKIEILKVEKLKANFYVKGIGNKRNTVNYYFVRENQKTYEYWRNNIMDDRLEYLDSEEKKKLYLKWYNEQKGNI